MEHRAAPDAGSRQGLVCFFIPRIDCRDGARHCAAAGGAVGDFVQPTTPSASAPEAPTTTAVDHSLIAIVSVAVFELAVACLTHKY